MVAETRQELMLHFSFILSFVKIKNYRKGFVSYTSLSIYRHGTFNQARQHKIIAHGYANRIPLADEPLKVEIPRFDEKPKC